jgi:hypothetical protein
MSMSMSMDDSGELRKQKFGEREPRWDEKIKWYEIPDDATPHAYRLIARPVYYAQHWIQTRKQDGTNGKPFAALCKNYDSENSKFFDNGCKICEFVDTAYKSMREAEKNKPPKKDESGKIIPPRLPDNISRLRRRVTMAHNCIVREDQEQGPPSNNATNWSFVHAIRLPQGVADSVVDLQVKFGAPNPAGGKYGFSHKDFGKDIYLSYNSQAGTPTAMYSVVVGPKDPPTPLTADELKHGPHLVNFLEHLNGKYPKDETLEEALRRNGYYDWLEKMNAAANLSQIERVSPPVQVTAQPQAHSAFDDGGGMTHSSGVAPAPAKMGNFQAPPEEDDVPMDFPPVQQAKPAPQKAAASAPASNGSDIQTKLQAFANETGKALTAFEKDLSDVSLKFYKPGLNVPACFTQYSANDKAVCKKCPIRLDCMMTDN